MSRVERGDRVCQTRSRENFLHDWRQRLISRRRFLISAMASATAVVAGGAMRNAFAADNWLAAPGSVGYNAAQSWSDTVTATLRAVQSRLFPADEASPGADDINALGYLLRALEDPALVEDRQFIHQGVGWLDELATSTYFKTFLQLDTKSREQLLHQIAHSSAGENWLSTLLVYICEALLTDPVYGGNPDGIGWSWLQHAPGFPRPPADKTYRKLG